MLFCLTAVEIFSNSSSGARCDASGTDHHFVNPTMNLPARSLPGTITCQTARRSKACLITAYNEPSSFSLFAVKLND